MILIGDKSMSNSDQNINGEDTQFENMCQKYRRVDVNDLDYLNSEHAMAIQRSQYVKIEDNKERIFWQKYQANKNKLNSLQLKGRKGALFNNQ